jgi:nickel transport protein
MRRTDPAPFHTRFRPTICGLLAVGLALRVASAYAHEYWFERVGDELALYQGHLYSSHAGEERVTYDPVIVKEARCLERSGTLRALAPPASYPARFPGGCAALWVQTSSGYWSQSLTGTVNRPKTEVRGVLRSWLSEESIKRLDAWLPALAAPLGHGLELVPGDNPLTRRKGDKLRLLASWQGKPRSGVAVAYDGEARGVTDAEGRINIRIRHGGAQVISASFEEATKDPNADKVVRATVLQFQLPE